MFKAGGFFKQPMFIEGANMDNLELFNLFGEDIVEKERTLGQKANMFQLTARDYFGNKLGAKEDMINSTFVHAVRNLFLFLKVGRIVDPNLLTADEIDTAFYSSDTVNTASNNLGIVADNDLLGTKIKEVISRFVQSVVHWVDNEVHRSEGNLYEEVWEKHAGKYK